MMKDREWAEAFVGCKIAGTGIRFAETVEVLAKKLAQVREEAAGHSPASLRRSPHQGNPEPSHQQAA